MLKAIESDVSSIVRFQCLTGTVARGRYNLDNKVFNYRFESNAGAFTRFYFDRVHFCVPFGPRYGMSNFSFFFLFVSVICMTTTHQDIVFCEIIFDSLSAKKSLTRKHYAALHYARLTIDSVPLSIIASASLMDCFTFQSKIQK